MKIKDIEINKISVPLKKAFKTALRTVDSIEDVFIKVKTDTNEIGYGSAPPTGVITGDTKGAIIGAIEDHIKPNLIGMKIENLEDVLQKIQNCVVENKSAKAAVDMAIYDLYGKLNKLPLYKLLGGKSKPINTDITISVNSPKEMVEDSIEAIDQGFNTLKIKVGANPKLDIKRIESIKNEIGNNVNLRIDANQAWTPSQAVNILKKIEQKKLDIELVEQPVKADDLEGLKFVTNKVNIPILADESIFSPKDALKIINMRAADLINIKLMKTGGIYNALKICSLAEMKNIKCMIGCMLENKVSVTAAVHLAMAKNIITKFDLDSPLLCKEDNIEGGALYDNQKITLSDT